MAGVILLTGGAGMVGRNIQAHPGATPWRIDAPGRARLDLRDAAAVADYIADLQPELVLHAAGKVGGIAANIADPVRFLDENVMIGRNVIMGARRAGVRRLLNLGSTCMYPRAAENPLREQMILTGPLEPTNEGYALAKLMAMRLCQYIRAEAPQFLYKTLIPCNLYGLYDRFDAAVSHLVPAILVKLEAARRSGAAQVEIWGDGLARREFMFASDLAEAIWRAVADLEALPDLMNIGVGQDHTINEYYAAAADVIGWQGEFVHDLSKPVGMARKLCDTARQRAWGWQPQTTLAEGLARTWRHYQEADG